VQFLSNIAQFLLVVGISFAVLALITSFIRFQHISRRVVEADQAVDPHDAFQVQIANRLGTVHLEPEPFLVMVLAPDNPPPIAGRRDEEAGEGLLDAIEKSLEKGLRGTDTVVRMGDDRIGAIVDAARENATSIVQRLLAGASGPSATFSFCAGISTHPENGNRVKTLMESATASLHAASLKGRGQFVLSAFEGDLRPAESSMAPGSGGGGSQEILDPLTGVLRQDRVHIALQKYVAQYRKQEAPVSILVLDVDHFERYGEHYGPSAGDEILRRLGVFLQGAVRESDLLACLEERTFLIAMGCAPRDAMIAAQRIIGAVKKTAFPVGGSSLRITLSLGVAGYPDHGGHPRKLVEAATTALQGAKDSGRGMCLMYEPTMRPPAKKSRPAEMF
jgi:diguanylate cyclase (GGDEF)-like protein